ncbi:hypothetical protein HZY97_16085 [Sphingomonas sp. R-74633]|uniref:hypothetical protein n=1 Tax=Sphingomonas sp. R-74633 TaxID=2751188 RepID=UPI0015D36616|nr:hypothetical protein [Sphingomonas sp. R-74633]NYT42292.1 hypothetical protein [Sphingomonas sp. R-74633]
MPTSKRFDEQRVRAALNGPNGEVLRLIAIQPNHPTRRPPSAGVLIPVARA